MKVIINGVEYPNIRYTYKPHRVVIYGARLPEPEGVVSLQSDDGFELNSFDVSDWLRCIVTDSKLELTDEPAPVPPTEAELLAQAKADALARIDGKCSGAIYSGVTIADKHYSLSLVTQQNLKTAQDKITAGATSVIFAADGEEPTVHTAEQITAISNAAYEWGVVNTSYYAKLQKWIARETDTAILNAIDYGSVLPNDLMSELATLLAGVGIDLAKYSTMLGG